MLRRPACAPQQALLAYLIDCPLQHVANSSQYWCPSGLVVTVEGPEGALSVTTDKPFARIGADESAEVLLPSNVLPRRALYLHATKEGVFWVNLAEVSASEGPLHGWLEAGRPILVGEYRISARLEGYGHSARLPLPDLCAKGTIPEPLPALTIAFDGEAVARRRLSRRLTLVGRRRPSALRISSLDLSASHLVLYWESGRVWAVDLLSRTGMKLDGERIEAGPFPVGSSLTAGEVTLKYERPLAEVQSFHSDIPVPLEEIATPEMTARPTSPSATFTVRNEKARGDASAVLTFGGSSTVQGHLLLQRENLRSEREQWLREQAEREAEWKRRLEELDAREAMFLARQQAREAALERRAAELEQRQAELETAWAQLDVQRHELEQQRATNVGECRAGEPPFERRPKRGSQSPGASSNPPVSRSASTQQRRTVEPPQTGIHPRESGLATRDCSDAHPEACHDEVMDRLFRVSKTRRNWWKRFWSIFSGRTPG